MPAYGIPRQAIASFEAIHALRITVHDLRGSLWPFIDADRLRHGHPLCVAMKSSVHVDACMSFDLTRLRNDLPTIPEGRFHVCHAGLVEWVVPVHRGTDLEWILFAGVRTADPTLDAYRAAPIRWERPPWAARSVLPPPVGTIAAEQILEHVRQLAARLQAWSIERERQLAPPSRQRPGTPASDPIAVRRTLIHRFIEVNHTSELRLADLAAALGVGVDRAGRLVRQCSGRSFRECLIEARLRTAMELLRNTRLSVLQASLRSGFNEVAHFNRIFRRRTGTTPTRYRNRADV